MTSNGNGRPGLALTMRGKNIFTGGYNATFRQLLPLLLLLLALSTVFLFGGDRRHFYRDGLHDVASAEHLSVAVNLSPEHNFLLFQRQTLDKDGAPSYAPYSRFPMGGYGLVKLSTLPFGDGLTAKIYAARMLFLLFFVGSAVLAYLSLCRLADNRWIALTATLLAFSSYYLLYYNDMLAPENSLSLFGVLLTFHGMVLFVQEGRFRQLLIKACAALLLGWHVYALLLPFIVLGLLIELNRARRQPDSLPSLAGQIAGQIKGCAAALLFSRYLRLGVITLLFGIAALSFNLGNEYRALDGAVSLTELPTVQSMTYRFGADDRFNDRYAAALEWGNFLEDQFYRIARATLPFSVSPFDNYGVSTDQDYPGVIIGVLAAGAAVLGLLFIRQKMLLATLVSAGFCWAVPMRHNTAFHEFESVFYIGIPLVLCLMALGRLRGLFGGYLLVGIAGAALLVFVTSSIQMGSVGNDRQESAIQAAVVADFERIRTIVEPGQSVFVPVYGSTPAHSQFHGMDHIVDYYLAGRVMGQNWDDRFAYNFVVFGQGIDIPAMLTPENRQVFLYRRSDDYSAQIDELLEKSELVIRRAGHYDVYRSGNRLIYVGNQGEDSAAQFSRQDIPIVGKPFSVSLSPSVRRAGLTDRGRWQWERGSDAAGWNNVPGSLPSPTYRYTPTAGDEGYQLRASVDYTDHQGNRVKATTAPSLPVLPAPPPGAAADFIFFLQVIPADGADLPDHRQQYGFDNLNFRFDDYALPLTDRPIAVRQLPDYDIAFIRTGQSVTVGGVGNYLWEGEFPFNGGE